MAYPTTFDIDEKLETYPHYTDRRFDKEQTVFGKGSYDDPDLRYDYSDRLRQWDSGKANAALKVAEASGAKEQTARFYHAYLEAYFGKSLELKHIIAGVNKSDGYPYQVFGYKFI
jgi:hypothetical protein